LNAIQDRRHLFFQDYMGENFGYWEIASIFLELLAFARSWILVNIVIHLG
jgi:hypothetical protein